jgi:hypothetical protein
MVLAPIWISRVRVGLLCVALSALAVASLAGSASAGVYHVFSCRMPNGASAPVDGWSGSQSGVESHATNNCSQAGGALVAALGDGLARDANTDIATWTFAAPAGEVLSAGSLWRAADADGGVAAAGGYETWFAGPANNLTNHNEYFGICEGGSRCPVGVGDTSQPLSAANLIAVPSANLGSHLYMSASCVGESGACPVGEGDANHYAAVVYLYAADLTLEQTAGPSASGVGGELASAPSVGGTSDVTFSASDPGSGVYEALVSVDGQLVQSTVINENGGRCRNVGQTTDGNPAFLYLQPCPASLSADVGLDTTRIANGAHHLVVSVIDAAGNAAPVLDRTINVYNAPAPGTPGPANGTNASSQATLAVRWKTTPKKTLHSPYGRLHVITGRLTTTGGAPIVGAQIDVTRSSVAGKHMVMSSPRTDASGRFSLALPRSIASATLGLAYRTHIGDPLPVTTSTLKLEVGAGISLRVTPRTASVGSSIFFHGRLLGGPVPAEGKQLVLEARSPGGPWIEFEVVRTNARGRFHASYRFKFPGPATYEFRARSEPESDYPFAAGASSSVAIREH